MFPNVYFKAMAKKVEAFNHVKTTQQPKFVMGTFKSFFSQIISNEGKRNQT